MSSTQGTFTPNLPQTQTFFLHLNISETYLKELSSKLKNKIRLECSWLVAEIGNHLNTCPRHEKKTQKACVNSP